MRRWLALCALGLLLLLAAPLSAAVTSSKALPSACAALALGCVALASWLERHALRDALRGRQARLGLFAGVHALALLAVLGSVAFLAARHPLRWDLTRDRLHTLAPETLRVLASIPAGDPVELYLVDNGGVAAGVFAPLARLLAESTRQVQVRPVDALQEPMVAASLGLRRAPALVARYVPASGEPRVRRTEVLSEEAAATLVAQVVAGDLPIAYVTAGHGELAVADQSPGGFSSAARALREDNFELRQLILGAGIPSDAAVVIVPGPEVDFLPPERESLQRYLENGGRVLLLLGPSPARGASAGIAEWLRRDWGLVIEEDLVADLDGLAGRGVEWLVARSAAGSAHPILRGLSSAVIMPLGRSVRPQALHPSGVELTKVLESGPRSWLELDIADGRITYEGGEPPGPHPLAVAAEGKFPAGAKDARLVVVGSSAFAANGNFPLQGNTAFLLNCTAWLTERPEVLDVRRPLRRDGTLVIEPRQGNVLLACAAALPLALLLGAFATWLHRRRS